MDLDPLDNNFNVNQTQDKLLKVSGNTQNQKESSSFENVIIS